MIKFHCETCGKKLGVPEEYAGKKVRCTQCSNPVRVPEPVVEEVADEEYGLGDLDDLMPNEQDLADQMGLKKAVGVNTGGSGVVTAPVASAGQGVCPNCGAVVRPDAKLCVGCGNFIGGGKVKTKKGKAKEKGEGGGGAGMGRMIGAVMGGGAVAVVMGVIYAFMCPLVGWGIAWGMGALVGLVVSAIAGYKNNIIGGMAAGLTVFGLLFAKAMFVMLILAVQVGVEAMVDYGGDIIIQESIKDEMVLDQSFSDGLQKELNQLGIDGKDGWEDRYMNLPYAKQDAIDQKMNTEIAVKINAMTEDEKEAYLDGQFDVADEDKEMVREQTGVDNIRDMTLMSMIPLVFTWWDAVFFPLAIFTAFKLASDL
ncbi:hypothetical protein [Poriferisphaera sp. WC338]|uniref:hypothetical protein n=1 Tax=Poriferisphaera sp. WC338 TaxID=3425129 RepID=UPI003D81659B